MCRGKGFDAVRPIAIRLWEKKVGQLENIRNSILVLRCLVTMTVISLCTTVAAQKIVTPIKYTSPPNQNAPGVFFHMERVPTSNVGVYLTNLTCVLGIFGKELRYTIVKGPLQGNPRKTLFIRTYQTDRHGYMRAWTPDNYRWHPFNAGLLDIEEQRIEMGDAYCDRASHIETAIVRGEQRVPAIVRCVSASCAKSTRK